MPARLSGRRRPARAPAYRLAALIASLLAALASPVAQADGGDVRAGFAQQVLALINAQREPLGLPALQPAADLDDIAAQHSRAMAGNGRLSHDGFSQRFLRTTRQTCVENLASGLHQPSALVTAWWASPVHQRNLVAPRLQRAGLANVAGYVTFFACD